MRDEKIGILTNEILQSVAAVKKTFREHMPPYTGEFRLPPHQFHCLNILYRNDDPLSMSELAEKLAVSNQQLTRIVDLLVGSELAERSTSPDNRRVVLVKISEKGKNLVATSDIHMKTNAAKILSDVSEEEIDEITFHIRALKEIMLKIIK